MPSIIIILKNDFNKTWIPISNEETLLLKKGFIFNYNYQTTIRDLFLKINEKLYFINQKFEEHRKISVYNDNKLKYFYRIINNGHAYYIFDIYTKFYKIVKYFNLKNYIFIGDITFVEKGGKIYTYNGYNVIMHSKEYGKHHIPHVHIKNAENEISVDLDGNILEGSMHNKKIKNIIEWIKKNKQDLLLLWKTKTDGSIYEFEKDDIFRTI